MVSIHTGILHVNADRSITLEVKAVDSFIQFVIILKDILEGTSGGESKLTEGGPLNCPLSMTVEPGFEGKYVWSTPPPPPPPPLLPQEY